ncbi:MAG: metal-sulfur cluster assembly factor [Thermomicrobiales bacterium]|nr:metal-sulfur cluster assembly factor [Thermomicrobiales bacterium]
MLSALMNEDMILAILKEVYDPELGVNVVDLGLVYGVEISNNDVRVTMTLTTPGCPLHDVLTDAVDSAVRSRVPGVDGVEVNLVWYPPWTPDRISDEGKQELGWW